MIEFGDGTTFPGLPDVSGALARLGGVFRSMPESKLLGMLPDGRARAVAGHDLADEVAKAAQGIAERAEAVGPSVWREVPFVGPFVVGDQLTVMAYELTAALHGLARADEQVWVASAVGVSVSGGPAAGRATAERVLAELAEQVRALSLVC